MRLAIVGSRDLAGNKEARRIIREVLDRHKPSLVVSGGAVGVDAMAANEAGRRGIGAKVYWPCKLDHFHTFRECYQPRNLLIATFSDRLVRIGSRHSRTGGSAWTLNKARELGRPTEEFLIDL